MISFANIKKNFSRSKTISPLIRTRSKTNIFFSIDLLQRKQKKQQVLTDYIVMEVHKSIDIYLIVDFLDQWLFHQ